jgi:hypothetical protein
LAQNLSCIPTLHICISNVITVLSSSVFGFSKLVISRTNVDFIKI